MQFSSISEADSDDDLGDALKNVREIPLERYLEEEKAKLARQVIERRKTVKKPLMEKYAGGRRNLRCNSDENGTRHAISDYDKTDWSDLDSEI